MVFPPECRQGRHAISDSLHSQGEKRYTKLKLISIILNLVSR
jgi:hypothetical protein